MELMSAIVVTALDDVGRMKAAIAINRADVVKIPNLLFLRGVTLDGEFRLLPRNVVRRRAFLLSSFSMLNKGGDFALVMIVLTPLVDNGAGANPCAARIAPPTNNNSLKYLISII